MLARAIARGDAFLLQGGDCAESFDECTSDNVVQKLKILLQMSLVMLVGLKKPIIRVGRMAGQYAKPRSEDYETRDGVTLPSYRGDLINRPEFTEEARTPDPQLMLRGYERAALTLNFIRALVTTGFVDPHRLDYWDLAFVHASPMAEEYRRIARTIGADPWELRLRNAYRNGDERPYRKTVEDATLIETIQAAASLVGHELSPELQELRS